LNIHDIQNYIKSIGLPGRDLYEIPDSKKLFPDSAHYRIEIAGIERASTMEAMIKESDRRGVPVHRAIATVGGSIFCDFQELRDMSIMAREAGIEVIATLGPRKTWDPGSKEFMGKEGMMQGFKLRGSDNLSYWLADMIRCIEAGFRGFLVYDEGVLYVVNKMREDGIIPSNTIFKFSVFGGHSNAAGLKLLESLGANSVNPISDLSLPILAGLRSAVDIPLDIYIIIVDSFGGTFRPYEATEIARVASPCYFKFEPGTSEAEIYKPWVSESWHRDFIREKIKIASIVVELMEKHAPEIKLSPKKADDLSLPEG